MLQWGQRSGWVLTVIRGRDLSIHSYAAFPNHFWSINALKYLFENDNTIDTLDDPTF